MRWAILECQWYDVACNAGNTISDKLGSAANGAFEKFIVSMNEATGRMVKIMLSWWMDPSLSPKVSGGGAAASIASIQGALSQLVLVAAFIGIVVAMVKMAVTQHARFGRDAVFMLGTTIVATSIAAAATGLFVSWSDGYSTWMMNWATQQAGKETVGDLIVGQVTTNMLSVSLLSTTITGLAALAQAAFMVLRAALIPIILVFLPVSAATTATGAGKESFNKLLSWLVAFVLYKPIAATIYALGITMVTGTKGGTDEDSKWFMTTVSGMVVIALAVLALPALIKLCAPIAAAGTSSLFSGGSALVMAGGLAAGAVSLGAAGGAAAAAAARGGAAGAKVVPTSGTSSPPASSAGSSSPALPGLPSAPKGLGPGPSGSPGVGSGGGPGGGGSSGGGGAPARAIEGSGADGSPKHASPDNGGSSSRGRLAAAAAAASTVADAARAVKTNAEGAVGDDTPN